ncbi:HAMP domain-containing sensor histidine kinase [Mycolicibacterium neworleansense]|uniref:histidine kinase n=1 Tax=Mycolicibacterium neworleansense TaxID=146018 RepID=A0A0H5RX34_9MYCO|nr:ATP-binding protein [Mycolicibacterium neworleansense]MCV7362506.1 HAMP domain-containing protein [Mycolicibacterium neworleansense]CRZ18097.1 integral membrane sensor signal transduction histidine kinase [Mycolicibacterium neworleansense]
MTVGLRTRLLSAQALVLLAGAGTTGLVAAIVGPPLFREHLHRAGVSGDSAEQMHAEEAYVYATVISIGVASCVAILAALIVTWYVGRRLQRSLTQLSQAATAIADGHYDSRVPPAHLGDEFDSLARSFNQMAGRLEAVDAGRRRLFSDLAHEIRTPVSVLEAYFEAIEDGVRTLDPETVSMLRQQTHRLVRFAGDAGALAKAEETPATITPVPVSMDAVVAAAIAAATDRFDDKGVTLSRRVDEHLPSLSADPHRLAQILGNLLDNALRHTPAGGRVTITAAAGPDRSITLTVADTGEGIPAEHLAHVFDRFYRADTARDRDHGGSGIGLAIVKALVEGHRGHISVSSSGTGTTFTIILPTG